MLERVVSRGLCEDRVAQAHQVVDRLKQAVPKRCEGCCRCV
jgi:hypothetical protein